VDVSVWVIVLLVLLSGAVAAVGDWLGRRLGKKRLRIGKLRPKHTAIVTTFIAGMLITGSTILILTLMSEQVRRWLLEGANVQQQLSETRGDLSAAQRQLDSGRKDIAGVRAELQSEREKLSAEQKKVEDATKEAAAIRSEAVNLKSQVAMLVKDIEANQKELGLLEAQYAKVEDELRKRQADIKVYAEEQDRIFRENNRLLAENDRLLGDIEKLQKQIDDLNKSVEDAQSAQETASAAFATEKARIEAEREAAQKDLLDAQNKLSSARNELNFLQGQARQLADDSRRSRVSPLIFSRGDELSRLAVRSRLSQAEARNYLLGVMEMASREAVVRGAVESQQTDTAVGFLGYKTQDGREVTEEMLFAQAVMQIAAKEEDQLIVVRTLFNAFKGDWIAVEVAVVENPIVYRAQDFIIETKIDGRLGVQKVTEALVSFIAKQLRDRAESDGMVPAIGRPTELGEVTQEQIQQVVGDIVATERTITVRFHALRETRAGDTLALEIRLR
jgi:peptidoglycan hydrolase CwlO-like protein